MTILSLIVSMLLLEQFLGVFYAEDADIEDYGYALLYAGLPAALILTLVSRSQY